MLESRRVTPLARQPLLTSGLGIGVVAALLACLAVGREIASGPGSGIASDVTAVELPVGVIAVFLIAAALLVASLAIPARWPRVVGVGVLTGLAATLAITVIIGRTSGDFLADSDVSLETGGSILIGAFMLSLAGLVLALVGARELAEAGRDAPPPPGTSGRATAALVLGIAGFFAAVAASLAIVFATLAFAEIARAGSTRTGRGLAVAGLVLGIVALSLWAILLLAGVFAASPSGG